MGEAVRRYRTLISDSARWDDFPFRDGDVVISTPPKCGTTWMQMLCGLLIFDTADFHRPLSEISPWLDMTTYEDGETRAWLEAQDHRRFIKTHAALDGLPFDERATYICVGRDPRDVSLSWNGAFDNVADEVKAATAEAAGLDPADVPPPPEDPRERFRIWVDSEIELSDGRAGFGVTLANLVNHVQTFWGRLQEPRIELFHYADLAADLEGQMRRLAGILSIDRPDERIRALAAAARFDRMKERADDLVPAVDKAVWKSNRAFFRSGTSGGWRDVLDAEDLDHYETRLKELAPPELAAWLHGGWLQGSRDSSRA